MTKMAKLTMAGVVLLTGFSLGGCLATQKYVDTHVAPVQGQVTTLQGTVNDQNTHLGQLDQTSREALERATAAGKLAEGKFLYQMVLSDDSVKFPLHSYTLSAEAQARLMDFVQKLKADNKNVYLEIQGHTDSHEAAGMQLGEERAEAVRRFMNQQGVPLNRMATISYGAKSPVAPNNTRAGRAQNRRVVVIVMA
jgi:outer membrane protein OmpA-like peptidoglycan-associated protein